jgi:hypothetical protein
MPCWTTTGHDETMQIEREAILDGRAVHLGDEAARGAERRAVEPHAIGDRHKFVGRLPRMGASAATDVDAKLR